MLYSIGILLLGILINQGYFVKGKTCPRIEVEYRSYRECNTWCWGHHWETRPVYVTRFYCCPGYSGSISTGCNTPICNPPCKNGGQCTSPNHCECGDGHQGISCEQESIQSNPLPTNATRRDVNVAVMDWLRGARDRNGERKIRSLSAALDKGDN